MNDKQVSVVSDMVYAKVQKLNEKAMQNRMKHSRPSVHRCYIHS